MIDDEIKELVLLAQNIIRYYFGNLDEDKKQIMEMVFARTPVMYGELDCNGRAYHEPDERKIVINEKLKYNYERVLSYLIHEYAHMFSDRNYEFVKRLLPKWLAEGMADTFADLVINNYFKHNEATIDGQKLIFNLPYVSYSCYSFENSFARTLLYPLEIDGNDKDAVQEFMLGDIKKFLEMVVSKEFSEQVEYNEVGVPKDVDITTGEIYHNKSEYYQHINRNSLYFSNNAILSAFVVGEKVANTGCKMPYELGDSETYTDYFIENTYFQGRKLYQIYPEELKEFLELYEGSCTPKLRFFSKESYIKFINSKIEELLEDENEIINNCDALFNVIPYLINKETKSIGSYACKVIAICLKAIVSKIKNMEFNDAYIQEVYFKLKNFIIPLYQKFSVIDNSQNCILLNELLNSVLKNIENRVVSIDKVVDGSYTLPIIGSGTSKKCYDLGNLVLLEDNNVMIDGINNYHLVNRLNSQGVNIPRIISMLNKGDKRYIIEEKAEGTPLQEYTPNLISPLNSIEDISQNYQIERQYVRKYLDRLKEISQNSQVLDKFVYDYFTIIRNGGFVDPSEPSNFIYNEQGISFVDVNVLGPDVKFDEKMIFHYILYSIFWCNSMCFTNEEIEEESKYKRIIINKLKEICKKYDLPVSEYFVAYNNKSLDNLVEEQEKRRREYQISSEEEYIEHESELLPKKIA